MPIVELMLCYRYTTLRLNNSCLKDLTAWSWVTLVHRPRHSPHFNIWSTTKNSSKTSFFIIFSMNSNLLDIQHACIFIYTNTFIIDTENYFTSVLLIISRSTNCCISLANLEPLLSDSYRQIFLLNNIVKEKFTKFYY